MPQVNFGFGRVRKAKAAAFQLQMEIDFEQPSIELCHVVITLRRNYIIYLVLLSSFLINY